MHNSSIILLIAAFARSPFTLGLLLIAAGTVEEKILELSAKKRALVSNVLSTEGSPLKGLTKADVENLFSE